MHLAKESLFISAFRAFFNALFAMVGILVGLIVVISVISLLSSPQEANDKARPVLARDQFGHQELLPKSVPIILKLNIHGVIGKEPMCIESIETILEEARSNYIAKRERLRGIFLDISSPGGSAIDSELIFAAIERFKQEHKIPVVAYTEGLCASGGYFIAMAGDKFYANSTAIIGSVGVRTSPFFNVKDFLTDHKVKTRVYSIGKFKTELDPFIDWPKEPVDPKDDPMEQILQANYRRFTDTVLAHRPHLSRDNLLNVYGASVFDAADAEENGYVDSGNMNYYQAMADLAKTAGVGDRYQVVQLVPTKSFLSDLMQNMAPLLQGKLRIAIDGMTPEEEGSPLLAQ